MLLYLQWANDSSIERGMIWMTIFVLNYPSSYLFVDRSGQTLLFAAGVIVIGGLQWALIGALFDLIRTRLRRGRPSHATNKI